MAIEIKQQFEVDAPAEQVWAFVMDPHRVAPCMPGATLDEVIADVDANISEWVHEVIADGERSTTGWIETPEPPSEEEARPLIPTDINQEQVLALIELWKLRLEGAQKAWEQVQEHFPKSDEPAPTVEEVETWQDVLERDIERLGYRAVVAKHLLPERPSFEIEKIVVDGIRAGDDPLTVFDIELAHVSSDVTLQESSPTGAIASRSGQIKIGFEGHQLRNETEANVISFQASEIPVALVQR